MLAMLARLCGGLFRRLVGEEEEDGRVGRSEAKEIAKTCASSTDRRLQV